MVAVCSFFSLLFVLFVDFLVVLLFFLLFGCFLLSFVAFCCFCVVAVAFTCMLYLFVVIIAVFCFWLLFLCFVALLCTCLPAYVCHYLFPCLLASSMHNTAKNHAHTRADGPACLSNGLLAYLPTYRGTFFLSALYFFSHLSIYFYLFIYLCIACLPALR